MLLPQQQRATCRRIVNSARGRWVLKAVVGFSWRIKHAVLSEQLFGAMNNVATEASLVTRLRVFFSTIPFITLCTFGACTAVFGVTALTGYHYGSWCLAPQPLVHGQLWRVASAALMHAGLLHLAMNMLALLQIGSHLERALGSLQFLWAMLLALLLGDGLYVGIAYLAALLPLQPPPFLDFMHQCAVGFSGVLFALIVLENHTAAGDRRSIFGLFWVPARAYPWVLLLVWQLLVPQASFLGHLTGLLAGELYVLGLLRWAQPSSAALHRIEAAACGPCMHLPSFIAHTAATAGDALLPLARPPGASGYEHISPGSPRIFANLYRAFPDSSHRLPDLGTPRTEPEEARGPPAAAPHAPRLGGGQQAGDARAAAASAAEARAAKAAGAGSRGSSSGSS